MTFSGYSRTIIRTIIYILVACFFSNCSNQQEMKLTGLEFKNMWGEINANNSHSFTKDLTIDMYIKLHSYPRVWTPIIEKAESDRKNEFKFRIENLNSAQWFYSYNNKAEILRWIPNKELTLDEWHRLTAIRNIKENQLQIYIDGNLEFEQKVKGEATFTNSLIYFLGNKQFQINATVAELRIWDKAFSRDEIIEYTIIDDINKVNKNLIGYWRFKDVKNGIVPDLSENKWNLKIRTK